MASTLLKELGWAGLCDKVMLDSGLSTPGFKAWLLSKEKLGGYFFNSYTWRWAYQVQHKVNNEDMDHLSVTSGMEGYGKSTLAIQQACVIDPSFCLERICYKPVQFIDGIIKAKKGQAFVLDEGVLFTFARESQTDQNRIMLKLMALMRQYNLVIIICIPNFHLVDSYIRNHRAASLFHLHEKGNFTYYNQRALRMISTDGARFKQVGGVQVPRGTFFNGYFNKDFPILNDINYESYMTHKDAHFKVFLNEIHDIAEQVERGELKKPQEESKYISIQEARKILPFGKEDIRNKMRDGTIKGKKVGTHWLIDRDFLLKMGNNTAPGGA